jgi:carboxymethylenebutenolidase
VGDLSLSTPDGEMPAYEAGPVDGTARGAVVVVQEAFGLNGHIRGVTDRIGAAGYHAVAPALFHRQGSPTFSYDDVGPILPVMKELRADGIAADVDAVLAHLTTAGFDEARTAITGFCMGGTVALWIGAERALGASVTWYGGGVSQGRFGLPPLVEVAPSLRSPWLGLFGDRDQGIPVDDVEALRAAAATATVPTEVVRYAEAEHGFNCDERPSYDAAAAGDGWARMLTWFERHLGGVSAP